MRIEVAGLLDSDTGECVTFADGPVILRRKMPTYCYTLNVDGVEQSMDPAECETEALAIERGKSLLRAAVDVKRPQAAYVAVFMDQGADDEPLGAWDWSREAPEPAWEAAE